MRARPVAVAKPTTTLKTRLRNRPWVPTAPAHASALSGVDLRNLALIVAGFLAVLLLIPPGHEYPVIDDWTHVNSVKHQLETGAFEMPPLVQANLVGLTLWGTLWARLFGTSYTVLTLSTLALALVGLLAFYGLARRVEVPPAGALLGTALLGFNPLFLHLSYSFMTDVPFVALVLAACYGYVRGLQSQHTGWLWAAGLCAAWAFTIRQFAILVPLAFGAYLLLEGLLTRRWRWMALLAVAVPPALTTAAWWLWTYDWPALPGVQAADRQRARFLLKEAWPRVFLIRMLAALPLTALSGWTALKFRAARLWLVGLWALVIAGTWVWVGGLKEVWIAAPAPPFTVHLGPLAFVLPQQINTYVGLGNILRIGGFDFFEYDQEPIWAPAPWALVFVGTTALGVLLLGKMSDGLLNWVRARIRRGALAPLTGVYLEGLALFVGPLAAGGDYYDRYLLGFVPFVILFMVRGARGWRRWAWRYALVAVTLLAVLTLLLQRDYFAHADARWRAAKWLAARAQPVRAGFEWNSTHPSNEETYKVADLPLDGFRVEQEFAYQSWLTLSTRHVYAQAAADAPPLPAPAPSR